MACSERRGSALPSSVWAANAERTRVWLTTGVQLRSPEGARSATEGFVSCNVRVRQHSVALGPGAPVATPVVPGAVAPGPPANARQNTSSGRLVSLGRSALIHSIFKDSTGHQEAPNR
jgi:hypothetical protein